MRPIEAHYENGLLRPAKPLALRPQEQMGRRPVVIWQSDTLSRVLQSIAPRQIGKPFGFHGEQHWSDNDDRHLNT